MNTNIVNPKKARRIDSDQFDVGSVTSRMLMGERTLSIMCPFIYLPFLYAYAFFGAWMFTRIESKHSAVQSPYKPNNQTNQTGCGSSYEPFADVVRDGIPYSISVFTTVGYGVQAPETSAGRIATIFYAMLGIPLYFAFTADIQDRIDQLIFVWLYGLIFNKKRHQIKIARWKKFLVTVFIAVSYLFIQGAITMYLESKEECGGRWTYMVAVYFVFQSAALIGFGDLTASRSLYLTVHLPMLIIGQVLLQSLFAEAIKYIRYKFPLWVENAWDAFMKAAFNKNPPIMVKFPQETQPSARPKKKKEKAISNKANNNKKVRV
uniref:Potassium channel domain-containing protein n=2 Tax=Meloidogyne enterolobii TaxID=390850 RepID=A0A6V7XIB0_MELEN|nr:unnamed protein product [Meloidogyne enterolobii]